MILFQLATSLFFKLATVLAMSFISYHFYFIKFDLDKIINIFYILIWIKMNMYKCINMIIWFSLILSSIYKPC